MKECKIYLPLDAGDDAHDYLKESLIDMAGGLTMYSGIGAWDGDDGEVVERTMVYEVLANGAEDRVNEIANELSAMTDEDTIMYSQKEVERTFVSG